MKKWIFAMTLLAMATGVWADDQPGKTTTVGGGVSNPWRSPYKTALVTTRDSLSHQ